MGFLKQVKNEIKNIFSSKFILIFAILVGVGSIASPVITALTAQDNSSSGPIYMADYAVKGGSGYYDGGYYDGQEPIPVGDALITSDNPFYGYLSNVLYEKQYLESYTGYTDEGSMLTSPEAVDLAMELMDAEFDYYGRFAVNVTTYEDYRFELAWTGTSALYDIFVYSRVDSVDHDVLREAANYRLYLDSTEFDKKYYEISATDRLAAMDTAQATLDRLFDIVENNNFDAYIDLMIAQQDQQIASLKDQIDMYYQTIQKYPDQQEVLEASIKSCQDQIDLIENSTKYWLEFRREHGIIPYSGMWQDTAINDITNSQSQLQYTTKMTKEEFDQDSYNAIQYGSYENYVAIIDKQIDNLNNTIKIAENCLNADQPDMKYVPDGARYATVSFLSYSAIVAIFAVLLGGWLIASEFQFGTIRLLMIRPKTRTKILMSKFLAALIIAFALYIACALINILMNGILFGFSDFAFPNMTIAGSVGFFAYYLPKFIACAVTIVFAFCVAFMLSVIIKNIAVSIIIPIVCYVGSMVLMNLLSYNTVAARWLAWTPVPYLQLYNFFVPTVTSYSYYSYYMTNPIQVMMQNGAPISLLYGIILLLALSGVCILVSILTFRKKDITH
jgi:ABC-2 type transport system permease protein